MPELPDVETMRRLLEREALRRRVSEVEVHDRLVLRGMAPRELSDAISGKALVGTDRHGKWLFAEVERGPWLVMHFGMTGALAVSGPDDAEPRHTRVTFRFADGGALHYRDQRRLGRLGVTPAPIEFAEKKRLGPDALDPKLTAALFVARFEGRRGPLKGILLDQGFIAGIGNIYADEICHVARIAPLSPAEDLSAEDRKRLFKSMRSVLRTAVDREAGARGFPKTWLIPHRHADAECPDCPGKVVRQRFQGRYTYWCGSCQTSG